MAFSDLTPYLFVAPLTAAVGWITNLLAVKMLFYPVNFVGFGTVAGWQGIIPRLRVRLTRNLVNLSIAKICTPQELIEALDDEEAIAHIQMLVEPHIEDWIEDILDEQNLQAWQLTPSLIKKMVIARVKDKLPALAREIRGDIAARANQLVDFAEIAVSQIQDRPEFLNELFLRCAGNEMRFVIRSGVIFGFPLGCLQAVCWYLFPYVWVLPVFGVVAGAGTNWIALKLIAHPAEPKKIGPFTMQGLYLKRQQEVSAVFGEVFTTNFLTPKAVLDYLWAGPGSQEVHRIIHRRVRKTMDQNMISKLAAQLTVTPNGLEDLQRKSIEYTADRLIESIDSDDAQKQLARPIANLISSRMSSMKPSEFQQLLLPAFEEDQFIVVLLGGILGGAAGMAQLVWLFGR